MKSPLTIAIALAANFAFASSVFAGAAPAPAARPAAASATAAALAPASLAGFVQAKGARPDSAVQGAVKIKLISEFAQPTAQHGTHAPADVPAIAGYLPAKNAALQGLMSAGQNNDVLLHGIAKHK